MATDLDRHSWRQQACCDAEPMCVLCPVRPENSGRTLGELAAAGLKARLVELPPEALREA